MTGPTRAADGRQRDLVRSAFWAAAFVSLIFGAERILQATSALQPVALFHAAVIAASWFGGLVSGFLALFLSFVLAELFLKPTSLVESFTVQNLLHAGVFLGTGVLGIGVTTLVRTSRQRERASVAETAAVASELLRATEELARSAKRNQKLQEVTAALLRALTPAQVIQVMLEEGVPAADAAMGLVVVAGEGGGRTAEAARCPAGLVEAVREAADRHDGPIARALAGEPAWLERQDPIDGAFSSNGHSWAVLPISVRDRHLGALVLGFADLPGFDGEKRSFAQLLAQECGRALERARLYAAERNARVQAQFAERQVGFLAVASARLSATLDMSRSLAEIADLAVGHLGDFCAIHLVHDGGPPRLVAGSMGTASGIKRFGSDDDPYPVDPGADIGYPAVLRTGRGELLAVLDDALIERAGRSPEQISKLKHLGIVTQVCVPLRARDQTLGCITLASRQAGRRYTYADLVLAEELASRVAQSIDNAALYQAAIAASKAKSSFLAVMSHELRTPLNAILGYSDLILMGVPSEIGPETRHQVDRIRSAARHLLEMVDDVLNFARIETGKDRVRVSAVNLDLLIREAVAMVNPAVTEKGLALAYHAVTGVTLHTDEGKVMQILNNLLSNAVKFTNDGRIEVHARIDQECAVVDVADSGIGIPRQHLDRIFDPFWQVEPAPTRRYGGTGIGLGIARNLSRLLGGDLTVDSTEGVGSVFTVRLPLRYEAIPPEI